MSCVIMADHGFESPRFKTRLRLFLLVYILKVLNLLSLKCITSVFIETIPRFISDYNPNSITNKKAYCKHEKNMISVCVCVSVL